MKAKYLQFNYDFFLNENKETYEKLQLAVLTLKKALGGKNPRRNTLEGMKILYTSLKNKDINKADDKKIYLKLVTLCKQLMERIKSVHGSKINIQKIDVYYIQTLEMIELLENQQNLPDVKPLENEELKNLDSEKLKSDIVDINQVDENSIGGKIRKFKEKYKEQIQKMLQKSQFPVLHPNYMKILAEKYIGYVKFVQVLCNTVLEQKIEVDGAYGIKSAKAVRSLQEQFEIKADGIVGKKTWEAIFSALDHKTSIQTISMQEKEPEKNKDLSATIEKEGGNSAASLDNNTFKDVYEVLNNGREFTENWIKEAVNIISVIINNPTKEKLEYLIEYFNQVIKENPVKIIMAGTPIDKRNKRFDAIKLLIDNIVSPKIDASILLFGMDGFGIADKEIMYLVDKRQDIDDKHKSYMISELYNMKKGTDFEKYNDIWKIFMDDFSGEDFEKVKKILPSDFQSNRRMYQYVG